MKIRAGFVSNSSSSSFVLVGIILDKKEYDIDGKSYSSFEDKLPKDYVFYIDDEMGAPDGKALVGKELAHTSDEYFGETKVFDLKVAKEVAIKAGEVFGLKPEEVEPVIVTGDRLD